MSAFLAWLLALFRPPPRAPSKRRPRWTFRRQNCCIQGETGSGKTSGSLAHCLRSWLFGADRPGAIFLCSKGDDARKYVAHLEAIGRGDDVHLVTTNGGYGCCPLAVLFDYPWATPLTGERLLKQVIDLQDGNERGEGNAYFDKYASEVRLHAITLCLAAFGSVRCLRVLQFIESMRYGPQDASDGFAQDVTRRAIANADGFPAAFRESVQQAVRFVTRTFPLMPDKQREGIRSTAVAGLNVLLSYPLNRLMGLDTLNPQLAEEGGLIVVDLPVLEGHSNRLYSALLRSVFETIWIARKAGGRDILSVVDEAHMSLLKDDPRRLSVSRESGLYGIRLFQTLEVAQVEVGGSLSEELVKALIEQCPLKVCHQLPVGKTADYFSRLAGEFKEMLFSGGGGTGEFDIVEDVMGTRRPQPSVSWSEQYRPCVPAYEIAGFLRGGPPRYETECLVIESGKKYRIMTFPQVFV